MRSTKPLAGLGECLGLRAELGHLCTVSTLETIRLQLNWLVFSE
jgi:hypothetical protein